MMTVQTNFAGLAASGNSAGTYAAVESAQNAVVSGELQPNRDGLKRPFFILPPHPRSPVRPVT
jgi:hypothetical protein